MDADTCPLPINIPGWSAELNGKWQRVRAYCINIQECISQHANLDEALVAAVIMQESGGDPNVINANSGATGLMQIMPDFVIPGRPTQDQLLDPAFNIQTGCNILSAYIDRYGSIRDGLWAYGGTNGTYAQYADIVLNVYDVIRSSP